MSRSTAPWTPEQVDGLNRWQAAGWVHEFTCGNEHTGRRVLYASADGWRCRTCDYRQTWAHDFMLDGPPRRPFASMQKDGE